MVDTEPRKPKRKIDPFRRPMPKQDPEERIHNMSEVALGFPAELARQEARRCLLCKKPQCIAGCPVGIDIPGFLDACAEGDFETGIRILKQRNALPAVCGRVCPQEDQCEKACVVGKKNQPVAIGRVERFLADWEAAQGRAGSPTIAPATGKKVAVVGAGPAGLTVAADLAVKGHRVTIFEALHECGGVLVYGIPEFRLPKAIVRREVDYIRGLGVEIQTDFVVGRTRRVDDMLREFDAMFIATGAGLPWFMDIPGENLNGYYSANEYLTRINLMKGYLFPKWDTPSKNARRVAVFGGGNVAMDCARSALRTGAEEVHIVYRRSRAELPARLEEVENAEEEGVIFDFLTLPTRMIGDDDGRLKAMECLRMELGEPDASGRRRPVPIEGSEFVTEVDVAICAIGNSPNPVIPNTTPGLEVSRKGTLVADENGLTSKAMIWAGGDVVTGAATVILAMGAGRVAANAIHTALTGETSEEPGGSR